MLLCCVPPPYNSVTPHWPSSPNIREGPRMLFISIPYHMKEIASHYSSSEHVTGIRSLLWQPSTIQREREGRSPILPRIPGREQTEIRAESNIWHRYPWLSTFQQLWLSVEHNKRERNLMWAVNVVDNFLLLSHLQAWKRVRGEKGEKDITSLRGSGCMLPNKKN